MHILIKNGTLVTDQVTLKTDILMDGEKISAVGRNLPANGAEVIDASGLLVMPGGVDVHVHLDLPMFGTVSSDDHYTGMKAAAFGGTTTVIDFIPQDISPLRANFEKWLEKAESRASVDYSFHMNITRLDDQVKKEIPLLVKDGITSIKVFTAYNGRLRLQDGEIFEVMRIARDSGILTLLHAENGDVIDILVSEALRDKHVSPEWHARTRPAWGAVESVLRGAALAAQAGCPLYIVHMNAAGEVDQLEYACEHDLPIMGETCPQYLVFTEEKLKEEDGAKWICSPPMRTAKDNLRLWEGIQQGIIQTLATDHCPFFYNGNQAIQYEGKAVAIPGKELGSGDFTKIPNGLPGVGDRLPIFWTEAVNSGRITPNKFVALTSTQPARVFGMYPQKGSLEVGSDADILLWDPNQQVEYGVKVAQHRTDYNLYEGWKLTGFPKTVFLRGQMIVDSGEWFGKAGMGRFIKRRPFETAF